MKSPHYNLDQLIDALNQIKKEDDSLQLPPALQQRLLQELKSQKQSPSLFWHKAAAIFIFSILGVLIWILQPELRQNHRTETTWNEMESESGYMPLTYGLTPEESLQRVRVKLPRSALDEFGITLQDARTDPVTADILVGESGLPYAVRVVHQN